MVSRLLLASLLAVAVGGIATVFLAGDSVADKRRASLQSGTVKSLESGLDKNLRKKQIADGLKELEKSRDRKRVDLKTKIEQAGLSITKQQFFLGSAVCGVVFGAITYFKFESIIIALLCAIIGFLGIPNFVLSRMRKRRINNFIKAFPGAMDIIVRGIKAGLPLGDCIRIIATEAPEPVRSEFRAIIETQAMGVPLGEAVARIKRRVPITEANFFAIVIAIQTQSGGNLSEALANLSRVLRERMKMRGKISAMSMEAKASAVIIGAVPFVVTGLLYMMSPQYISLLWTTFHGKVVALLAIAWMAAGAAIMKKMTSFDF